MRNRIILVVLILIGLLLIYFNQKLVNFITGTLIEGDERPVIAEVYQHSGKVRYKVPQSLRFKDVDEQQPLRDQDTVSTDNNSKVLVRFISGYELEILPNSMVVIEQPIAGKDGRIQITFLQGDFRVIKQGSKPEVFVAKDEQIISLKDTLKIPDIKPKPVKVEVDPTFDTGGIEKKQIKRPTRRVKKKARKKKLQTLSDDYISRVVSNQKPFFNRCYAQHLRLNPDSRGQIHLAFTIESTGKVSNVEVLNSTIADIQLQRCTMSVIQRCQFKDYQGQPTVVNYPINFE